MVTTFPHAARDTKDVSRSDTLRLDFTSRPGYSLSFSCLVVIEQKRCDRP